MKGSKLFLVLLECCWNVVVLEIEEREGKGGNERGRQFLSLHLHPGPRDGILFHLNEKMPRFERGFHFVNFFLTWDVEKEKYKVCLFLKLVDKQATANFLRQTHRLRI